MRMMAKPSPRAALPPSVALTAWFAAPWPLGVRNDLGAKPRRQLEAIGDDVDREIVVADEGGSTVSEPNELAAAGGDGRWAILTDDAVSDRVIADLTARIVVERDQLRHVLGQGNSTFRCVRRFRPALPEIPAPGLCTTCGETGEPARP